MTNEELLKLKQEIDSLESYTEFVKRTGFKRRTCKADSECKMKALKLINKIDGLKVNGEISISAHSYLIDRLYNRYYGFAE